jgi:hypothetical protein
LHEIQPSSAVEHRGSTLDVTLSTSLLRAEVLLSKPIDPHGRVATAASLGGQPSPPMLR